MAIAIVVGKLVVAYLLGSLSGSLLLGRLRGVDIRTQGSGNAGGTNALRTQGWAFALVVVAIDIGKGALAAALPWLPPHGDVGIAPSTFAWACTIAAMIGHLFPVFFGFRGGKGAAVLVGAMLVVLPWSVPVLFGVWLVVLGITGYVGLATVIAATLLPVAAWTFGAETTRVPGCVGALVASAIIVWAHRENLARLRAGNEYRFERARFLARLARRGDDA